MTDYEVLREQVRGLLAEEPYYVAAMSNISSVLKDGLPDINWAGFYIVRDGALTLGPFQGKTACIHIPKDKGVCGAAWRENRTMLVPDVHQFPGHIACDSASNAEIVIPLREAAGEVKAVLDIDSPTPNRFSEADRQGLEAFAHEIERAMKGLEA